MKKILLLLFTLISLFTFPLETLAVKKEPLRYTINISTLNQNKDKNDIEPQCQILSAKKTEKAYSQNINSNTQNPNLSIVDRSCVTVRYELWIVKALKKIFMLD